MTPKLPSRSTFDGPLPLVIVTSSFPIRGDGSEAAGSFVADIAEDLAKHVPVHVVAPGAATGREAWQSGVEVFRYAAPSRPLSTLKLWRPGDAKWIARVLRGGLAATRNATEDGASHLLALWALPCGEWARRVSRETGIPYSVWTLGSDIWTLGRIPVIRSMLRRVLRGAATCYSDGIKLANDTRRIAGRDVQFLPSTRRIEAQRNRPLADKPPYDLLFLGRWHLNKGVDLLLDALALLEEADWSRIKRVNIQGGGPLEALVHRRVRHLAALGHPVKAGHYLTKVDAGAALTGADWLLIPSRIESIPIVFSDAMKSDLPVVATTVGDLGDLVRSNGCGILAEKVSAIGIATAIKACLSSSPSAFQSGLARAKEAFDLKTVALTLRKLAQSNDAAIREAWESRARDLGPTAAGVLFKGLSSQGNARLDTWHALLVATHLSQRIRKRGVVLDLGSGYGRLSDLLAKERPDLTLVGQDLSHAYCQHYLHRVGNAVQGSFTALPFRPATIAGVLAVTSLMYADRRDVSDVLRCIRTLMEPEAPLLLVDPGEEMRTWIHRLVGRSVTSTTGGTGFRRKEYLDLVKGAGFNVIAQGGNPRDSIALLLTGGARFGWACASHLPADRAEGGYSRLALHRWILATAADSHPARIA